MQKKTILIILFITTSITSIVYTQNILSLTKQVDKALQTGMPFNTFTYNNSTNITGEIRINQKTGVNFNSLGIGWSTNLQTQSPSDFHINYRYQKKDSSWSNWAHAHGEITPLETPTNLYWSSLIVTDYMEAAIGFDVKISHVNGDAIQHIQIDASYLSFDKDKKNGNGSFNRATSCPQQPFILQRLDWWGTLPANELYYPNATNTKTVSYNTNTTHAFIHHGASSNNYTDGASIVRAYWSYHVNTRGWKDIGYNYLIDKFGNLYMGRYNDDWPAQDVKGAHTGVANPYSFAICCIGDYASISLPPLAMKRLEEMLAYKCDLRNINPIGTGFIYSVTINNISGHRDAPSASTTCPGNGMYATLPTVRTNVKAILDSCALNPTPTSDNIPPLTTINYLHQWKRYDFATNITDVDDSSGIQHQFLNVSYKDVDWTANDSNGYFADKFTTLSPKWTSTLGTWQINTSNSLTQTNEAESNTNLYAYLNQNTANKYLYHWKASISGVGTNKRAGLHFMCDSGMIANRGDSYFVYFREDNNKVQIYKTVGNVLYLKTDVTYNFSANTFYDFKVIFNKANGKIDVFINNQLASTFTDPWPHTNGNYISFRTGNCVYDVDFIDVYKERSNPVYVSVGNGNKDIAKQNPSVSSPSGKIKSIAVDGANNISLINSKFIDVDWTIPSASFIHDGLSTTADVDTFYRNDKISGTWLGADVNSGIKKYYFTVGDSPGASNIVPWLDLGAITQYTNLASLTFGTTYYVSVRVFNGAGLDTIITSDGQLLLKEVASVNELNTISSIKVFPNPHEQNFTVSFNSNKEFEGGLVLINSVGKSVLTKKINVSNTTNSININTSAIASGIYFLKLESKNHHILLGIKAIKN